MNTIHFEHSNGNCIWSILNDENIYGSIHNFVIASKMSTMVDSLTKLGLTPTNIESYFQDLGINVYEDHIRLYLKYGITKKTNSLISA